MNLFILLLASYGLTFAVIHGKAWFITNCLQRWAFFRNMFACALCTGTEIGGWGYFFYNFTFTWGHAVDSVVFGLAAGAFAVTIESYFDAHTKE